MSNSVIIGTNMEEMIGCVVVYNHRLILFFSFYLPAVAEMNRVIIDTLRDDELSRGDKDRMPMFRFSTFPTETIIIQG